MLFNTDVFLLFFAAVGLLYYLARHRLAARNVLIVAASYLFYGWWDWRFLSLLVFTSLLDFGVGVALDGCPRQGARQRWLALSIVANLSVLGFFKYCGFFVDSLATVLGGLGVHIEPRTWNIILPVGISFYTFQSISYVVDVYRRQVPATRDPIQFLAYVSFFPQLVAGPIERARNLLPQFAQTRIITRDMVVEGFWLIIWGMFQKVVIADNLAPLVELAYQHGTTSGPVVALATVAFALQVYGDFAGYSDIARGLAKLLGFELMVNFNLPYLATNLREFWRRWHISLSTWLRDYLYISLGGNRCSPVRNKLNLLITMLVGGLWHGAAWHFVLWGAWHGLGLLAHRAWREHHPAPPTAKWREFLAWIVTFSFVLYGWLLFRAETLAQVLDLTRALGSLSCPDWIGSYVTSLIVYAAPMVLITAWQARSGNLLAPTTLRPWMRALLQGTLLWAIALYWERDATPFIYFQF